MITTRYLSCLCYLLCAWTLCASQNYYNYQRYRYSYYASPSRVQVSFKQSQYTVKESDGRVAITIQAARRYFYDSFYVKIRASVNRGLGYHYASSYDFEESIQTVRFSSKQSTATVYIKIKDDNRVENTEAFQVEILVPHSIYPQCVLGYYSKAKVFIIDDDRTMVTKPPATRPTSYRIYVSFSQEEYRVKESTADGYAIIKATVSGHRRFPLQVVARSFVPTKFNLPAANGRDFKVGEFKLYFPVSSNVATVKIPIYNDYIVEGTEAFAVDLYIPDYYRNRYVGYGDPFLTKVIIDDDDKLVTKPPTTKSPTTKRPITPTVKPVKSIYARFSQERYVVDESAGYVTLRVTVSGYRVSAISVNVKVFVSSEFQPKAATSDDVKTGVSRLIYYPRESTIAVKIRIVDDKLVEGTEAFGVQLIIPDHHKVNGVKLGNPSLATVLIRDDDEPATPPVPVIPPPDTIISQIPPISSPSHSTSTTQVVLAPTSSPNPPIVTPVPSPVFPPPIIVVPSIVVPSISSIQIFTQPILTIPILIPSPTSSSIPVTIPPPAVSSSTSSPIQPPVPSSTSSSIQPSVPSSTSSPRPIPVPNIPSAVIAIPSSTSFPILIEFPTTLPPVLPPTSSPTDIIRFLPKIEVTFTEASYSANESEDKITFIVQASEASNFSFSVEFCTQNSNPLSAENGIDYIATNQTITFLPGETSVSVTVNITDDRIHEGDETFTGIIKISDFFLDDISIGEQSTSLGVIIDDDELVVRFLKNLNRVAESDGSIVFTIIASVASDRPFTVQVRTREIVPLSAEANGDYINSIQNITFDNADSRNFSVALVDNNIAESDESFEVFLQLIPDSPYDVKLGEPSVATVIINDDEVPSVRLLSNRTSARESDGAVSFTLVSSFPPRDPFTVQVFTRPRNRTTATSGEDFEPVLLNVTFEVGETLKNVSVPIIPDVIIEENERFYLQMEGFEGEPNTISLPDGAWATIIDDDGPESVVENDGDTEDDDTTDGGGSADDTISN